MKSITAKWYEAKVKYDKTQEDGSIKATVEQYVVDALSFTEAETSIIDEIAHYSCGEFDVVALSIAKYTEVVWAEDEKADKWYKAKISTITYDEKTGKELKSSHVILIQASSFDNANEIVDNLLGQSMLDSAKDTISETKILDVFMHEAKDNNNDETTEN